MPSHTLIAGLCALGLIGATATAGPEFEEPTDGDAGSSLSTATSVGASNGGQVGVIRGEIKGSQVGGLVGDWQDLYRIRIIDPLYFTAKTNPDLGAGDLMDPMLFLFNAEGVGIAAMNNHSTSNFAAQILNDNGQGEPIFLEAGIYYLAITSAMSEAIGRWNNEVGPIFEMGLPEHFIGQWGPGGDFQHGALDGWTPPTDENNFGRYEIILTGVGSVPAPGVVALLGLAGLGVRRRRRG
jgi:MYXO-CTERM domain-containing protein